MKRYLAILAVLATACSAPVHEELVTDPADYVSTLVGSQSDFTLSTGNTYPAIALPWGMNFWTPQTGPNGDGWAYTYGAHHIRGFKQTHQPSPWINDYGAFSLMPVRDASKPGENERASIFSHLSEVAKPYYYEVYLADHDIRAEITPTERAAVLRFTFPDSETSGVVIDAYAGGSYVKVMDKYTVAGYDTNNHGGVEGDFKNWFVVEFDKEIASYDIYDGDQLQYPEDRPREHAMAVVKFATKLGEQVHARVASSFISLEQAQRNLREVEGASFDEVCSAAKARWNEILGRIAVGGGTPEQYRTFYSCLYRSVLFPRKLYEIDENGEPVHYSPYNGKVEKGYLYTDSGFWDTFRALFPLLNLVYPDVNAEIQSGYAHVARENAFLPEWASPGHRGCMVGNNSASVVADAVVKGVNTQDLQVLYDCIQYGTEHVHPTVSSTGRLGHEYYNTLGYVPCDTGINESAARTLEYAYDDWCILQLAKKLGRPQEELDKWAARAGNWKNVYSAEDRLMRGRNADGTFQAGFSPYRWGGPFTEGNSWHYTWSVFHDVQGLVDAMGGEESFVQMLDSVFVVPPVYDDAYYGFRIHEIAEMQVADMGNYAHGNQPAQHMLYLYDWAGQPWKGQLHIRETMDRLYRATPDGYCGDEDNGQTSAWYVFSALGFYPVCPASTQYALGTPLFRKAVVTRPDGKRFEIDAPANSADAFYVQDMKLNGKTWTRNYLEHNDLVQGAQVRFDMGATPATGRGTRPEDKPYSFSREK
ncbi:MAG: GH92 family glycosyl hydrolase [Bacteroidales bacterium]|nr:GH92 family glycosyl hydrolase [Bacteroidales bacterium]